jgi:hypothetical protein
MTPAEVERFQSLHRNHLGKPLRVDGDVGPETLWALAFETLCPERRAFITEAQLHLDLVEFPPRSNDDPLGIIRGWIKRCGARPGDPWCASGLSAWLSAGLPAPVKIPGALNLGRRFPATLTPHAGDMGSFPTDDQGHGHCFLIIGVSALELMTIEGNLDNRVRCARRSRSGVRIGRTVEDVTGTCPGVIDRVPPANGGTR